MIQHVYFDNSRDRSWCGLYVGFHNPKPAMIESDYVDRRAKNLGANTCRNCARAFTAFERKR